MRTVSACTSHHAAAYGLPPGRRPLQCATMCLLPTSAATADGRWPAPALADAAAAAACGCRAAQQLLPLPLLPRGTDYRVGICKQRYALSAFTMLAIGHANSIADAVNHGACHWPGFSWSWVFYMLCEPLQHAEPAALTGCRSPLPFFEFEEHVLQPCSLSMKNATYSNARSTRTWL